MPFLKRTEREAQQANQLEKAPSPGAADGQKVTFLAVYLGLVASIGGFMFVDNPHDVQQLHTNNLSGSAMSLVKFQASSKWTTTLKDSVNSKAVAPTPSLLFAKERSQPCSARDV